MTMLQGWPLRDRIAGLDVTFTPEERTRLLLALDTLGAVEWIESNRATVTRGGQATTGAWWCVGADKKSIVEESIVEAVHNLRAALEPGEKE